MYCRICDCNAYSCCICVCISVSPRRKPTLLITDAYRAGAVGEKRRGEELVESVLEALRCGGNVLVPCDTAGRMLELLAQLDGHPSWIGTYSLAVLTRVADSSLECARASVCMSRMRVQCDLWLCEWRARGCEYGFPARACRAAN